MRRIILCLGLSFVAWGGEPCRAAAPPLVPQLCPLSLAEAVKDALEHQGYRVEKGGEGPIRLYGSAPISRLETERQINQLLLNVEVAYWNLFVSCETLSSREQRRHWVSKSLRACKRRHTASQAGKADVRQARSQYELCCAQQREAVEQVAESRRMLGSFTGLLPEQGDLLVPGDTPALDALQPNWKASLEDTMLRRPELELARRDVLVSRLMLAAERTDRAGLQMPFEQLNNVTQPGHWSRGPIMWVRDPDYDSRIRLAGALEVLKDQEMKAESFLAQYYRRLSQNYQQIQANQIRREIFSEELWMRYFEYKQGRGSLHAVLEAQQGWLDARVSEVTSIGAYNNCRAGFAFARGAILERHHLILTWERDELDE